MQQLLFCLCVAVFAVLAEKVKNPSLPIYATLDGVLPGLEADSPFRLQAYKASREFKIQRSANFEYCALS